jgi:hypothetical protein
MAQVGMTLWVRDMSVKDHTVVAIGQVPLGVMTSVWVQAMSPMVTSGGDGIPYPPVDGWPHPGGGWSLGSGAAAGKPDGVLMG